MLGLVYVCMYVCNSPIKLITGLADYVVDSDHRAVNHRQSQRHTATIGCIVIILHGGNLDHESQFGFRPCRGTMDHIFTVMMAFKKRWEQGLEIWIMFLDVKAFDIVPHELLWGVSRKCG